MKVLLDTNIIVHREASRVVAESIGHLFRLMDKHGIAKRVHPATVEEIARLQNTTTREVMARKLEAYEVLPTTSPMSAAVRELSDRMDTNPNSVVDSILLNELQSGVVDALISEDRGVHHKARLLGTAGSVFTIDSFLEKLIAEHPDLVDYPVPIVRKTFFGAVDLRSGFFDSFRADYAEFDQWFRGKSDEVAYVSESQGRLVAFLYLKVEGQREPYQDISPAFSPRKRLKIGTFKVEQNGYKIGERLLKIVFDNALAQRVDEIYVTIFRRSLDHLRLMSLLHDFGFVAHGTKSSASGAEEVLVRDMRVKADRASPMSTYPFLSSDSARHIVPIYEEYHTSLFPDSILRTESPADFVEHQPHRNAIRKVYVSRSYKRDLSSGDVIVFYRTGGLYKGVVTTVGIVEQVYDGIRTLEEFRQHCSKRSVFSEEELRLQWDYKPANRPFVVQFLYAHALPRRPNLKRLIELGIISSVTSAPRGFEPLRPEHFGLILRESHLDESTVIR